MNDIKMIPIGDLMHHPENPRLDLGDLEELTASIKANGILQNLTVVPDLEKCKYLVVIGNRRLEAAKAAGLVELPCSIRDMDHQEQIATMLQENMQRTDLTVYEQAKGIQMMMDLGFDKNEICERTGFSRTTIDRRLAVASLPDKETQEAVECGWDLTDLVEISKIEDPEKQKKLLTDTAPQNLKQSIEIAKRDQERARERKRLLPGVQKFAEQMTPIQSGNRYGPGWDHLSKYDVKLDPESEVKVPTEEGKYYYCEAYGTIEIWRKAKKEKHVKTDAEIAREKKQHDAKELNERMRERRIAFCVTFTPTKKLTEHLKERFFFYSMGWLSSYDNGGFFVTYHSWDSPMFRKLCGIPIEDGRDQKESILSECERRNIPFGRTVLAFMLSGGLVKDDRDGYCSQYDGTFRTDEDMDRVYQILMDAGYELDDEERQWKEGTHEFYGEYGAEWYKAKYAHLHRTTETEAGDAEDDDGEES